MISWPPSRLEASPSEATVTSRALPDAAPGSSFAVSATAATFLSLSWAASTVTPSRSSIDASELTVNVDDWPSPVPLRPTTRP